jgi:3-dehydroquinate dehydratase/shikimate dehydrogenase
MIVSPIVGPSFKEAAKAIKEAQAADMLEFRLSLPLTEQRRLQEMANKPLIIPIKTFLDWEKLALNPAWVDLDYSLKEKAKELSGSKLLISFHDFEKTPERLPTRPPMADKFKLACLSHGIEDTFRLMERQYRDWDKTVAIAMGPRGEATRAWSSWSYAPSLDSQQTAAGQIPLKTLVEDYRFSEHGQRSSLYALIGDPVTQSPSHRTHNALFHRLGLDHLYLKIPLSPGELPHFMRQLRKFPFKGLSVTRPLKEAIIPFLDEVEDDALRAGAVNTVLIGPTLKGYNTDGPGAVDALESRFSLKNKRLAILGKGATARAIAFSAQKAGAHVTLLPRNPQPLSYDILVNATPVGMPPHTHELPVPASFLIPGTLIFDCVNADTALLQESRKCGCQVIAGMELFLSQAARQFALWL